MYCHEYDKTNLESSCFLQCYVKRLEITKILYLVCSKIEFLFVSSCNPRKKKSTQGKNLHKENGHFGYLSYPFDQSKTIEELEKPINQQPRAQSNTILIVKLTYLANNISRSCWRTDFYYHKICNSITGPGRNANSFERIS